MLRRRGFPIQLFVLTILPLTLLLLIIAFSSSFLHQRSMRQLVGERDERAARAAATAISEQLRQREGAIGSLALRTTNTSSFDHILTDADLLLPDFDGGIAIYDADHNLVASSNQQVNWELALPELVGPFGMVSGNAQHSDMFRNSIDGRELVAIVVTTPEGVSVAGAFSPASLAEAALSDIFTDDDQATAMLTDAGGRLLFQTGGLYEPGANLSAFPGVANALAGASGTIYVTDSGEENVVAFSPIPPLNWVLLIREPWRAVTDPLMRLTEWAPLVLAPVLIIALIGLFFGLRQIVQPLQSLERKAANLGLGDFEAIEQPVGGINEIQQLQSELIQMAQKVKLAQQSLRGYLGAVTAGQEEERRRLARDLHDDTIQSLIALNQRVQLAQLSSTNEITTAQLVEMQAMTEQTIANLRRLTSGLRPIYLEDLGLVTALSMLARDTGLTLEIPVVLQVSGLEQRMPPEVELALYRIAQEGLNNVARHAQATCADLQLVFAPENITLVISDDGRGFAVPENPAVMTGNGHFGLLGIRERAENIGARVLIESNMAKGTHLTISLPLVVAQDPG